MFTDIANHWAQLCIEQLAQRDIVSGYPDRTFRPEKYLTRAEFASLVCRAFPDAETVKPEVQFRDVPKAYWGYRDVRQAAERGFFSGYPDGTFQPNRPIPRLEAFLAVGSYLQLRFDGDDSLEVLNHWFDDANVVPEYARDAVAAIARSGTIVSYPNPKRLESDRPITRGEVAALLSRVLKLDGVPLEYVVGVERPPRVRGLPGFLNATPLVYAKSSHPAETTGILVSTFPLEGNAHLDRPLTGNFEVLIHQSVQWGDRDGFKPSYQAILLQNASDRTVEIEIPTAASVATDPDAPIQHFPETVENPDGTVFSGSASCVTDAVLRKTRQEIFPERLTLEAGETTLLLNAEIPPSEPTNDRTTFIGLSTSDPVYVASLVRSSDEPPTLVQWLELLESGERLEGDAAVLRGTRWRTRVTDDANTPVLTIPTPRSPVCLHLNRELVDRAIAPSESRFNRTYAGIEYDIDLPIYNDLPEAQSVVVSLSSPIAIEGDRVEFAEAIDELAFRGTVKITYEEFSQTVMTSFVHLTQFHGPQGSPLAVLRIPANTSRGVRLNWIYPPDGIPPHVLTVATL
ncbi:DUF3370 family protein [Baaleninema simplex]|uniref:DUF3370 family protein n=1 Tax=Baaleninema simplex TaxID=2862350 RepID=UPI00034D78A8|nr:DUF3370 family protein [Baaleninema simplex]